MTTGRGGAGPKPGPSSTPAPWARHRAGASAFGGARLSPQSSLLRHRKKPKQHRSVNRTGVPACWLPTEQRDKAQTTQCALSRLRSFCLPPVAICTLARSSDRLCAKELISQSNGVKPRASKRAEAWGGGWGGRGYPDTWLRSRQLSSRSEVGRREEVGDGAPAPTLAGHSQDALSTLNPSTASSTPDRLTICNRSAPELLSGLLARLPRPPRCRPGL